MKRRSELEGGFTIPELLVAMVLIIACAVGSYYLLKPKTYNAQERDAQRMVSVAKMVSGLTAYYNDNGHLPDGVTSKDKIIGTDKDAVNLCKYLVPKYMKDLTYDPVWGIKVSKDSCNAKDQQYITSFLVSVHGNNVLQVSAPMAEGAPIHVQRQL